MGHDRYKQRQTSYSSDHRQHNSDHRQEKQYHHSKDQKHHNGHFNKHHNRPHTKVNEIGTCSECTSECFDISDCEDHYNEQDAPTPDSPKN